MSKRVRMTEVFRIKESAPDQQAKQLDLGFGGPGSAGSREREDVRKQAQMLRSTIEKDFWMKREFERWNQGPKTTADNMNPGRDPRRVVELLDLLEQNQYDAQAVDLQGKNRSLWENLMYQAKREDEFGRSCSFLVTALVQAGGGPKVR